MAIRLLCCSGSLDGGGSERQLIQLATHINRTHYEPQIYLFYRRGEFLNEVPDDIPVHAFWSDYSEERKYLPGRIHALQVSHLESLIQRERIEIVYDRTFHMTLVTAAACRRAGIPRVSVIVSPPSRNFSDSRERFQWIKRQRLTHAYRSGHTIAVSQAVADDAAEFYHLDGQRISVIPSPVDVERVILAASVQAPSVNPVNCAARIAVIGRLSVEKGQGTAIAALAQAMQKKPGLDLQLELIGDGPLRQELEQLARSLGVAQHVHFHGFLQNPFAWMAACDLVCVPSTYEGLPNVALESMGLGIPLLATASSWSVVELLGRNFERGVVVPVDDVGAMAQQFIERVEQPACWLKRASSAAHWVRQYHSLEAWLKRMQGVFDRALDARPQGSCQDGRT